MCVCFVWCFSYGYPDATYLQRVKAELAAKGVVLETDSGSVANGNRQRAEDAGKRK